jgi:hypothetical protein
MHPTCESVLVFVPRTLDDFDWRNRLAASESPQDLRLQARTFIQREENAQVSTAFQEQTSKGSLLVFWIGWGFRAEITKASGDGGIDSLR